VKNNNNVRMIEHICECAFVGSVHKYVKVVSLCFQHDVSCAKLVCGLFLHSNIFELAVGVQRA